MLIHMARPRKAESEKMTADLRVKMLEIQYGELKDAAKLAKLELSSWVRDRLVKAARQETQP